MLKTHQPNWPLQAGGVLVLMILLICGGAMVSFQSTKAASQGLQLAVDRVSATHGLLSELLIAQAQLEKYVMRGDGTYLESIPPRRSRMESHLDLLTTADLPPTSRARVQSITTAVHERFKTIDQILGDEPNSTAVAVASREQMRDLELALAPVVDELIALLNVLRQRQESAEIGLASEIKSLTVVGLVIGLLTLALVLTFLWLMTRLNAGRLRQNVEQETAHLLKQQFKLSSELVAINESLRTSEARLSVMLTSIGDGVLATDNNACITLLNPVAELLTGWTNEEARGRPVHEIFHIIDKETREPAEVPVMDTLARGTVHGLANHTVLIAKGGQEFDIADSCAAIRDAKQQITGAILIFRDVTADYVIEQQLRDSNGQIRSILNTVVDAVITLDASSDLIETVNPAAERMFGYGSSEMEGLNFRTLVPELDQVKANAGPDYYSAGDDDRSIGLEREVAGRRKDGSEFPLEMAVSEMWVNGNRHFTAVLRDITLRKQIDSERELLNERLRDQHFYVRSLIESNVDAMMTADPSGIISDVNKQMEFLTGCTRDELIGSPFKSHFSETAEAEKFIESVLAVNKVTDFEMIARNRNGYETAVSCNATTFYNRDRQLQGVFASVRDVTDRKRLDRILIDSNVELERAKSVAEAANSAKSDFLSSMSHELRTPLSAILGFTQLIDMSVPPITALQKRSVDQILKAGWYLLELINEVLDLAVVESGNFQMSMESIELKEVLETCRDMLQSQASERDISIVFPNDNVPVYVRGDRVRLKQVLINLMSNAIKYNRHAGSIFLEHETTEAGRLRICIRDTGEGLDENKLAQLFQPFNRLGQEGGAEEGTGIGLVVCKRLVELMNGAIGADSIVGVGSSFWFELETSTPLVHVDDIRGAATGNAQAASRGAGVVTLLYVEDNAANLMLVESLMLRRPDIRLLTTSTGTSGVEMATALLPDVILMDLNLPGISGLHALKLISGNPLTAHIPVIAISANAMPGDIRKGLEAGFFRYLTKPLNALEFLGIVDEVFAMVAKHLPASNLPIGISAQPDTERW
jgi:PAS domain S-box-containing protein